MATIRKLQDCAGQVPYHGARDSGFEAPQHARVRSHRARVLGRSDADPTARGQLNLQILADWSILTFSIRLAAQFRRS